MQNLSNSTSLSSALKDWFDALKPLYSKLNSLLKNGTISIEEIKNVISLMKEASIACQKVSDSEFDLQNLSSKLEKLIANLEQQKESFNTEMQELLTEKLSKKSDFEKSEKTFNELQVKLEEINRRIQEYQKEEELLNASLETKRKEAYELEKMILEKKNIPEDAEQKLVRTESDVEKRFLNGFVFDPNREDIIEETDRYKYSKAKVEIMEMLFAMLSKEAPQLKDIWTLLEDIIYTYDIDLIHEKINGIKELVSKFKTGIGPSVELDDPEKAFVSKQTDTGLLESEKERISNEIELLSKSVALLSIENQNRKRKSDELNNRIEEKTFALQKMEQYLQELKENINLFELQYNSLTEKFSAFNRSERLFDSLTLLSHPNREFYFDEYYDKIQQFYKENKERIESDLSEGYEKLRNVEKIIELKQKELRIIEERINKEYPNYELKIANLQLRLQRKDKDIEILNSTISDNTEKLNFLDSEIEKLKFERKSFEEENRNLQQRISVLETDIKKKITDIQDLNRTLDESYFRSRQLEDQNKLLGEELASVNAKSDGYEKLLGDYKIRIEELQTQSINFKSQINELESSIQLLSEKLAYEEEIKLQKDDEIKNIRKDLKQAEETNLDLIDENGNFRKELQRLQSVLDDKIKEEERLREELTQLSKRKNEGEKAILELEKVNTSLASQIRRRENLIEELETENRQLKERVKETNENLK